MAGREKSSKNRREPAAARLCPPYPDRLIVVSVQITTNNKLITHSIPSPCGVIFPFSFYGFAIADAWQTHGIDPSSSPCLSGTANTVEWKTAYDRLAP